MTARFTRMWRGILVPIKPRLIPMSDADRREMEQLHDHNQRRRRAREARDQGQPS